MDNFLRVIKTMTFTVDHWLLIRRLMFLVLINLLLKIKKYNHLSYSKITRTEIITKVVAMITMNSTRIKSNLLIWVLVKHQILKHNQMKFQTITLLLIIKCLLRIEFSIMRLLNKRMTMMMHFLHKSTKLI